MSVSRILLAGVLLSGLCTSPVLAANNNPCPEMQAHNISWNITNKNIVFNAIIGKWKGNRSYTNAGVKSISMPQFKNMLGIYNSVNKTCAYSHIPFTIYWSGKGGSSPNYIDVLTLHP